MLSESEAVLPLATSRYQHNIIVARCQEQWRNQDFLFGAIAAAVGTWKSDCTVYSDVLRLVCVCVCGF